MTKIDLNQFLRDEDGTESEVTVGQALSKTLTVTIPGVDDKKALEDKGETKQKLFELWMEKFRGKDSCELSPKEIVLIRDRVGMVWGTVTCGQLFDLLDGNDRVLEKVEEPKKSKAPKKSDEKKD